MRLIFVMLAMFSFVGATITAAPQSATALAASRSFRQEGVTFETHKENYRQRERVRFTISNRSGATIWLASAEPWAVYDGVGNYVFSPNAAGILTPIETGKSKTWVWDQRLADESYVSPDRYQVVTGYSTEPESPGTVLSADFTIKP